MTARIGLAALAALGAAAAVVALIRSDGDGAPPATTATTAAPSQPPRAVTDPGADPLAAPASKPPSGPPLDPGTLTGRIVYSHEADVWVVNADGTDRRRLTTHPDQDFDPSWSPDGTRIAFRSHRDGNEEVYVMNADGSGQRNLSKSPGSDYSPAWSPDGEWIAFQSDRGGGANIWLARPDDSALRRVTDLPHYNEYPAWSPDGSRIAFDCTLGRVLPTGAGDSEICVVELATGHVRLLTDTPGASGQAAWSPDGRLIAFETTRHGWPTLPGYRPPGYDPGAYGDEELYVMNADGSDERPVLVNPRQDDSFPAWSRDGRLLFSRYGALLVTDASGRSPGRILDAFAGGHFPDWWQPKN